MSTRAPARSRELRLPEQDEENKENKNKDGETVIMLYRWLGFPRSQGNIRIKIRGSQEKRCYYEIISDLGFSF